jgi:hypothetical protein
MLYLHNKASPTPVAEKTGHETDMTHSTLLDILLRCQVKDKGSSNITKFA